MPDIRRVAPDRRQTIVLTEDNGSSFQAELFQPPGGGRWAAVLLPPLWGLDAGAVRLARHIVSLGATVLVPDMFWRFAPGPLDRDDPAQVARAHKRMADFAVGQGIKDARLACDGLRRLVPPRMPVSALGFCFGGRYAFQMAIDHKVDGAMSYHGTSLHEHVAEAGRVRVPVQLHYGGEDTVVPMAEVDGVQAAVRGKPSIELFVYPDCRHGFMVEGTANYDRPAAALAWRRTIELIDDVISSLVPVGE